MAAPTANPPRWARHTLVAAGLYNLAWGAWVVLLPGMAFDLAGVDRPAYPAVWQCVGMIVGVYGVGYLVAARDPLRHWPIVLVGLLGKVLGPIGFALAATRGELPWSLGWTILTNDLVWWAPFAAVLWSAASAAQNTADTDTPPLDEALRTPIDAGAGRGRTLEDLSRDSAVLVLFLRHAGCTFCREALADIARQRADIENAGTRIVLVHMSTDGAARAFAADHRLDDLGRIADPDRRLYRAFGLRRGSFLQLLGPRVWWRGLRAGVLERHGVGAVQGDGFQMPGLFLLRDGRIVAAVRHRTAADRPDYAVVACAA